ncbi:MAG: TIGR01244 family protein [Phenylobacterium zucineum]|nr:MAG: TIGR01244 family protein [Phenylobacterium zucineum]
MSKFSRVTDQISVAPQVTLSDMVLAAAEGFTLVINNRPDGEDPAQPLSADMEAAAKAAGLAYAHIPVRGAPTLDQVEAERHLLEHHNGRALAFCRSGTRSIVTWSLGQALAGDRTRDDLIALGEAAGYDLSNVLPRS